MALSRHFQRAWQRLSKALSWTPPTSTEIGAVAKSGLAAGLSWWVAGFVTDVPGPVLAPLTAVVVVQVSVRASIRTALQRSAAVVLGVFVALAIGDALDLNALTVTLLVTVSLGIAQLLLRLPPAAARQVPISVMVVLAAVSSHHESQAWLRSIDTIIGAAVGVVVSLVLPASRVVDAHQTMDRLADSLHDVLKAMGSGIQQTWSREDTEQWRRQARVARERLVAQATEAVGNGREVSRWNVRDRRHVSELARYEETLPRLERTAIGSSVIARGLDDHANLAGVTLRPMQSMGALIVALATAVRVVVNSLLGESENADVDGTLAELRARREVCIQAATRRARVAIDHEREDHDERLEQDWLNYAALLVQVDRIVADLSAPLPP